MGDTDPRSGLASAAEYFGARVAEYDSLVERAVPRYRELLQRLGHYVPDGARTVLELGCGTGNLSLEIAAKLRPGLLVLLDGASEMADLAPRRVRAAYPGNAVAAVIGRFEALPLAHGAFDLVVSAMSLHHVRDKALLYEDVFSLLRPGGTFLLGDQMAGATARLHDVNWQAWLAFCRQPGNCSAAETQSLIEHAELHDHYTAVPDHLDLLLRAGFVELDCVWRNWMWGILHARKPR